MVEIARVIVVAVHGHVHVGARDEGIITLGVLTFQHRFVIDEGKGLVESLEDRRELLPGGVAAGGECTVAHSLDEVGFACPGEGVFGVAVDPVGVGIAGEIRPLRHGDEASFGKTRQHRGKLLAGDLSVRLEGGFGDTVDHSFVLRPDDGVGVVFSGFDIGEIVAERDFGRPLSPIKHRHDHAAGHGPGGIEFPVAHAVHVAFFHSVIYRLVTPAGRFHVRELRPVRRCDGRDRPGEK